MSPIALYLLMSLQPFETDLCTFWPEGTHREPQKWAECCVVHDLNYWAGGSKNDRKIVDNNLRECVTRIHSKAMGNLMYFGVRAGSLSPIKLKGKGWGFSWGTKKDHYSVLSPEQINLIEQELYHNHPQVDLEMMETFITQLKNRRN